jgi:hypothetical protein
MMRGASGDECGNLLGQEYNRPKEEVGVLIKPREASLTFFNHGNLNSYLLCLTTLWISGYRLAASNFKAN